MENLAIFKLISALSALSSSFAPEGNNATAGSETTAPPVDSSPTPPPQEKTAPRMPDFSLPDRGFNAMQSVIERHERISYRVHRKK